jgi:hypothetical protein
MLIINKLDKFGIKKMTILSVINLVDLVFTTNPLLNLTDFIDVSK